MRHFCLRNIEAIFEIFGYSPKGNIQKAEAIHKLATGVISKNFGYNHGAPSLNRSIASGHIFKVLRYVKLKMNFFVNKV